MDSIFEMQDSVNWCDGDGDHADAERVRSHGDRCCSWSKTVKTPLRREAFQEFLREISGNALRAKGTVVFEGDPLRLSAFDPRGVSDNRPEDRQLLASARVETGGDWLE